MSGEVTLPPSRRHSTVSKRPRDSSDGPLREILKSFGQRATALDAATGSAAKSSGPSDACRANMWSLVLDMRPYVTAALTGVHLDEQVPSEACDLRSMDPHVAMRFVWPALRIYISVARIAASAVPGVVLHCILTLLSLLPIVTSRDEADEGKFFEGLNQALIVLHRRHPASFYALIRALVREEAMGVFTFSPALPRGMTFFQCRIEVPSPLGKDETVPENFKDLFATTITASSPFECVSVAHGLCRVMSSLFASPVPLHPTLLERSVLVRVACSLLAADTTNMSGSYVSTRTLVNVNGSCRGSISNGINGGENSCAGAPGSSGSLGNDVGTIPIAMTSAMILLRELHSHHLLVSRLHGPSLLYTMIHHICAMAHESAHPCFSWELPLLQWLADKKSDLDREGDGPREWVASTVACTGLVPDILAAIRTCCITPCMGEGVVLLFDLLAESVGETTNASSRVIIQSLRQSIANSQNRNSGDGIVETLLLARPSPLLWMSDMSLSACALYRLVNIAPRDAVAAVITAALERHKVSSIESECTFAAAMSSLVLCEFNDECRAAVLAALPCDWAVDAAVVLLRSVKNSKGGTHCPPLRCSSSPGMHINGTNHVTNSEHGESLAMEVARVLIHDDGFYRIAPPSRAALLCAELSYHFPSDGSSFGLIKCCITRADDSDEDNNAASWRAAGFLRGFRERVSKRRGNSKREVAALLTSMEQLFRSTGENSGVTALWEETSALLAETRTLAACKRHTSVNHTKSFLHSNGNKPFDGKDINGDMQRNEEERGNETYNYEVETYVEESVDWDGAQDNELNLENVNEEDDDDVVVVSQHPAHSGLASARREVGLAAHRLFLSGGSISIRCTLLSVVCLAADGGGGPLDDLVISDAMDHPSDVLRCGVAAAALRRRLAQPGVLDFSRLINSKDNGAQVGRIDTIRAAFALPHGPPPRELHSAAALSACATLWEDDSRPLCDRAAALNCARAVMANMSWSVDDLCRRNVAMFASSFFAALCDDAECEQRLVALSALDVLLPPCLGNDPNAKKQHERLEALLGEQFTLEAIFPAGMAYILLHTSLDERLPQVESLMRFLDQNIEYVPVLVNHTLGPLIVRLMSLEGERRLRGGPTVMDFNSAVEVALSVGECGPFDSEIKRALTPMESSKNSVIEGQALTKYVFYVLDTVAEQMGLGGSSNMMTVSDCTAHRWLCGLTVFVRFLGVRATLIAPKLPAILDRCSARRRLVRPVCSVWRELLANCTEEYRREHSPAIVVDLLSLEPRADAAAFPLLEEAMRAVYASSSREVFWESYHHVMGRTSALIRRLRVEWPKERNAAVVVDGFLSVMQSSSTKCKEVFVRALFQFLSATNESRRMEITRAAGQSPRLVPTLLNCVCELQGEYAQYALASVGIIGATAPTPASLLVVDGKVSQCSDTTPTLSAIHGNHRNNSNGHLNSADSTSSTQKNEDMNAAPVRREPFLPEDHLHWRTLVHKLLSIHCIRALSNTADPTMHDRAAFAVQELLRVCTDQERRTNGSLPLNDDVIHVEELDQYSWWLQLEPKCRQMLEGYTSTRYTTRVHHHAAPRSPIYTAGMAFHDWLNAWFCDLLLRCTGFFGLMMTSLRNIAKGSHALIGFLLPHIVVHLLREGKSDDEETILTEIRLLLSTAADVSPPQREGDRALSLHSQGFLMEAAPTSTTSFSVDEHVQQVFQLLEDLEHFNCALLRAVRRIEPFQMSGVDETELQQVANKCTQFIPRIEWTLRVESSVAISSHIRALRGLEGQRYLPDLADILRKGIPLQRIFAALGDRDSARSLHRAQEYHLDEAAFSHENNGDWGLALQACEVVLQQRPDSIDHQFTALRCMQQLGQLHLMSRYSQALLAKPPASANAAQTAALQNYANEAAWRLGEWESVQKRHDLPVSLAQPLVALTELLSGNGSIDDVGKACGAERVKIAPIVRTACRESYVKGYPHAVLMHALTDIETTAAFASSRRPMMTGDRLQDLAAFLHERAALTDATLETQEFLLSVHRAIFRATGMREAVATTWMQHAKLLRREGLLEAALGAARQALLDAVDPDPAYYTTVAKLLDEMGMQKQAIQFAEDNATNTSVPSTVRAKLRVRVTRWMQDMGYQTSQEVIAAYESAIKLNSSEKGHHYLALFYDTLARSAHDAVQETDTTPSSFSDEAGRKRTVECIENYVLRAIEHFGCALQLGTRTLTVSLPRMLTLWLNHSAVLATLRVDSYPSAVLAGATLRQMNMLLERFLLADNTRLPDTILVTALPQLLSRLGQGNVHVADIITRTVVTLMGTFPQQCLWQVMPIAYSKQAARSEAARQEIIAPFLKRFPAQGKLVDNYVALFKSLIDLCNCPATSLSGGRSTPEASLAGQQFIKRIEQMLPTAGIILPTMANLTPNVIGIPNNTPVFVGNSKFSRFEDRVVIMSSLQKPKRITVISDSGERVPFLCKSRDEPRKDMRMMEIASLMNTFFQTDPEARRKRFALRRYAIAALKDDCAVIEWVNNICPFRRVVDECYALDATGVRISQVKAWKTRVDSGALSKMDMLIHHILPRARPVLHNWFQGNFVGHQEWYQARTVYTQATALWSIAGHIVGLGDRHGENLMIDLRSGEMMHVDFACMFDKGEMLEVPERVRFRLTQNVVDGMGVLGVDGPFRSSCQTALRCQMKNKLAVMSVVETLLHDPLVEWTRQSSRHGVTDPKRLIGRVARRLDGFLDLYTPNHEKDTLALGCEGQVSKLISHSSSIENLSEMYIWWMPWL